MPGDAFSELMGDRRGAGRPVEGVNHPHIILLDHPSEPWRVIFLRDPDELRVNIGELGLEGDTEEGRDLISLVCVFVLIGVHENREISDEELGDRAVQGRDMFQAIPPEQWPR